MKGAQVGSKEVISKKVPSAVCSRLHVSQVLFSRPKRGVSLEGTGFCAYFDRREKHKQACLSALKGSEGRLDLLYLFITLKLVLDITQKLGMKKKEVDRSFGSSCRIK